MAGGQAAPADKPPMAEAVFKNVQVLKGIPADEFMGTMSVFSAALGESCETCHDGSGGWPTYALDTVPGKRTAPSALAAVLPVVLLLEHLGAEHVEATVEVTALGIGQAGTRVAILGFQALELAHVLA